MNEKISPKKITQWSKKMTHQTDEICQILKKRVKNQTTTTKINN